MNLRNFGDFFKVETATKERDTLKDISRRNLNSRRASWIGTYVQIDGSFESPRPFDSFYCSPTDELIDFIEDNMIVIDYDSIYFQLMYFKDYAILRAKYNQILGSMEVARIDLNSLPDFLKDS